MKSKLGIYLIHLGGIDIVDYVAHAQPRVAVSMEHNLEAWRAIKQASPNTFVIGRYYVDDPEQKYEDDPEGRAEQFFQRMCPEAEKMRGVYAAWMSYNEVGLGNDDGARERARRYSRFHVRWGDLMRQAGLVSCAYSFATGNPELDLWPYLAEGLGHCDLLSLHEYSARTMDRDQGWLCLRYRRAIAALAPEARRPVVITECGIDGGPIGQAQAGWSKFTTEAGYLDSLKWYDAELQKDDHVIGAAIFAMNGWGIDGSFGMGQLALIRDHMAQGGQPTPVVLRPPAVSPIEPAHPSQGEAAPAPALTYTVQRGDTLAKIARQFGTTVAAMAAANQIPNPNLIRVGQRLVIPSTSRAPFGLPEAAPEAEPMSTLPRRRSAGKKTRPAKKTRASAAQGDRPRRQSRITATKRRRAGKGRRA